MISDRCSFEEFVSVADQWDYQDIITRADREATEAERRFYHSNAPQDEKTLCGQEYAECLKGFIAFMRYGVKPARIDSQVLQHFDRIREAEFQLKRKRNLTN
jgi:hypothetical protein